MASLERNDKISFELEEDQVKASARNRQSSGRNNNVKRTVLGAVLEYNLAILAANALERVVLDRDKLDMGLVVGGVVVGVDADTLAAAVSCETG